MQPNHFNNRMEILQSTLADIETIFGFYDLAVAFQKTKFNKHWLPFDREMVLREITMGRQFKIVDDGRIACVFVITYDDPHIWKAKNVDPAMYIHRIVTHPDFRGRSYVKAIIDWARQHCIENHLQYIRMDTWGDNESLKSYYTKCGFNFMGIIFPEPSMELPKHYDAISLSLFEIKL